MVNGAETMPSWDVAAIPYPPPSSVQNLAGFTVCHGVKIQWSPPTNSAASPVQEYIVVEGGLQVAQLSPSVTNYNDVSATNLATSTYTYTVIATNCSGQSGATIAVSNTSPSVACDAAPSIASFDVVTGDDGYGSDEATLSWANPTTAKDWTDWLYETYEFDTNNVFGNSLFINTLQNGNSVTTWLWDNFTTNQTYALTNATTSMNNRLATLVQAIDGVLTNGLSVSTNSVFLTAVQTGRFSDGSGNALRAATTNLFNTNPTNAGLVQLKRMLIDDYFVGSDYFMVGPNWGADLTDFFIHFQTIQYHEGTKVPQTLELEASLSSVHQVSNISYADGEPVLYEYSWEIPAGALCWASVSAVVDGEEGEISGQVGPKMAGSDDSWSAGLTATPGYEQVYLSWNADDSANDYNLYYCTGATNLLEENFYPGGGAWQLVPGGTDLQTTWFWQTNLTAGVTYYYFVEADDYLSTPQQQAAAWATPTATSPAAYHFAADASPYDGIVSVEWTIPIIGTNPPPISLYQTNWQFYLERKLDGTSPTNYQVISSVGYGLAYLDSDVVNGQTYDYLVTAFDSNFNRLQTNAFLSGSTSVQITPSATNGLTLLRPFAGNAYVNLTWTPIRATEFTVMRSLSPAGPFNAVGSTGVQNAYQNAPNTYQDIGLQNGIMYYYQIQATTPTGFLITSGIQGAMPLTSLAPLPPNGFKGQFLPDATNGYFLLTWDVRSGAQTYQVFLRNQSAMSLIYGGPGTSCQYEVPLADEDLYTNFTFDVRSASASGLAGDFSEISVTNEYISTPPSGGTVPLVLEVAGSQTNLTVTGPTNLFLSANVNVPSVRQVSFYSDGQLIGTASGLPYQLTWYHVPGGPHAVTAKAFAVGNAMFGASGSTYTSQSVGLIVNVDPVLSAYQTSVTDLQLPAPGLPISLARSYTSRCSTTNGVLGVGWSAAWAVGSVVLSTELDSAWSGYYQSSLGSYFGVTETTAHYAAVTLPGGQSINFGAQLEYDTDGGGDVPFPVTSEPSQSDEFDVRFSSFGQGQGSLGAGNNAMSLETDETGGGSDWNTPLSFSGFEPVSYTYWGPDGTEYQFGEPGDAAGLTWLLTQVTDMSGNSLIYTYGAGTTNLFSISNSCGRSVSFSYSTPQTGITNISVFDAIGGAPVVVYVISNNLLTQVQQLINRTNPITYQSTFYSYGDSGSGLNLLTNICDPRGVNTVQNTYTNSDGDLMVQVTPGRTNIYTFNPANYSLLLTTESSAGANTAVVNNDSSGSVSGATVPVGGTAPSTTNATQCSYDSQGNMVSQTDANGNTTTYAYDSQNRLVGQSDGNGNSTSSQLDPYGQPTTSTDANGNLTSYSYDNSENPLYVSDPSGTVTTYTYSSPVWGGGGQVLLGEMQTSETESALDVPYNVVTKNTYVTTGAIIGDLASTTEEWVDSSTNALGLTVTTGYTYDPDGNRTSEIKTRTVNGTTETITTTNVYDALNRVVMTVVSAATNMVATSVPQTNTITYNALGKQATSTDAAGRVTTSVYDFNGNLIETEYPDGFVSRTTYDGFGRQQYIQDRAGTNSSGASVAPATLNSYDASGRVIMVQKFDSVTLTKTAANVPYDYLGTTGQVKMVASVATTNILTTSLTFYDLVGNVQFTVDALGLVTQNQYDADNRRTNTLVYPTYNYWASAGSGTPTPTGTPLVTSYGYDANGNQTTVTDAAGRVTTSVYDSANRLTEVVEPNGLSRNTYYDGLGRKIQDVDEAGLVTGYTYDFRGLLTSVTLAAGTTQSVTTLYTYDQLGNEIAQTDAAGRITTFQYDALGRRTGRTLPGGQSESLVYNLAGNLVGQTNFNGVIITNEYDVMNRLLAKGSVSGGYLASFAYNPTNGQRTNMVDISGTNVYQYDERGDLTNKMVALAGGPTLSLNYAYCTNGSLLALWDGAVNGVTNAYQYDVLGRLTNVLAGSGAVAGYGYDLVGNLQTIRYGNGVTNLCQYDGLNRLTNELWQTGGTPLANFSYALGATGNRTALNETVNGTGRTNLWVYDYLYRLTGETINTASGTGTVGYGHDAVGNRTVRTSTIAQIPANSASYTANDWLTTDNYDASGNTTNSGTIPYQYDALDHLTNMNSGQVLIAYDGDGNRVRKTVGTVTTYYLVDDRNPSGYAQVMEEWTNTGTGTGLSRVYNYGMDLVSQQQFGASPSTNYFVFDGHGSTRMLVSLSGAVANAFAYDAFGILIASNTTPQTAYLYSGQQFDGDLGFYYQRARYLNPNTGRFWTMDTDQGNSHDPLSLHKYLYCKSDPVNGVDPSGHGEDVDVMAGSFIGAVIDTFSAAATTIARASAISKINAIAQVTAAAYAGYLADDVAQVQVRDWVEKAKKCISSEVS